MILHDCEQGSPEWFAVRLGVFSASEFDAYCLNPRSVTLTIPEIKAELDRIGITYKGKTKREDLITLLPNVEAYKRTSPGALTAILAKIKDELPKDAWQIEMEEKQERSFEYNIPVQRGKALEPQARDYYERRTGFTVKQVGFCVHPASLKFKKVQASGQVYAAGAGCSPDGIVYRPDGSLSHGLEIKCPMPEKHLAYLLADVLPEEYRWQVHGSMAVTGADRWDFLSYCPGEAPLLKEVHREAFTDQLEAGLIELIAEKRAIKAKLKSLADAEIERAKQAEGKGVAA